MTMGHGTIESHWLVYIFPWWQPESTREAYITLMCHVALCIYSGLWHFHVAGGTLIHQHLKGQLFDLVDPTHFCASRNTYNLAPVEQ